MRPFGVHSCAVMLVLALGAIAAPSLASAATPPISTGGPPIQELAPPDYTSTVPGVGGTADCDLSGTGWTGFDQATDFVTGWQWYRDNGAIAGETGPSYSVAPADGGHSLTCKNQVAWDHTVTTGDPSDAGTTALGMASAPLVVPVLAKATNSVKPSISGAPLETGTTVDCLSGTWSDAYAVPVVYAWTRNGVTIPLETSSSYTLAVADVGQPIRCVVRVENPGVTPGSLQSDPVASDPVTPTAPQPPALVTAPAIYQTSLFVGDVADCDGGTWSDPAATLAFSWKRNGSTIPGEISASHTVVALDAGQPLVCSVIATNGVGPSAPADSAPVTPVMPAPPVNTALPTTFPAAPVYQGDTLYCDPGTWTGDNLSYAYNWYLGTTTSVGTNDSYLIAGGDVGKTVTCKVTASNGVTTVSATSAGVVVSPLLTATNTTAPSIAPATQTGGTLYCDEGVWTGGGLTYTFAWHRDGTAPVLGTASSYTAVAGDLGHLLTCAVTASNAKPSSTTATSNAAHVVSPGTPYPVTRPAISPTSPARTETATCDTGYWTNGPVSIAATWLRDGTTSVGTGPAYVVSAADVTHTLTCRVVGSVSGTPVGTYDSAPVTVVQLTAPANTAAPSLTAPADYPGATIYCHPGTWTGGAITFTYGWQRDGVAIGGAVLNSYVVAKADVGTALRCVVTATNAADHASATSAATGTVPALTAPTLASVPTVDPSSGLTPGDQVHCFADTPSVPARVTITWAVGGVTVPHEDGRVYVVRDADAGSTITCTAVATNSVGSSAQSSSASAAVDAAGPPVALAPPSIDGDGFSGAGPVVGDRVHCTSAFTQAPTAYAYVWKRGGSAISGATHRFYDTQAADGGTALTCTATATNAHGSSAAAVSAPVTIGALAAPTAPGPPTIDVPHPQPGEWLYCSAPNWTGVVDAELVRWTANDVAISGESALTYRVRAPDAGKSLKCEITAYNGAGPSAPTQSAAVTVDALTTPEPLGTTEVGGTPMATLTLGCVSPGWVTVVDSEAFAWQRDGVAIPGETSPGYVPPASDAGHQITCSAAASNTAGTAPAVTSPPVTIAALAAPAPLDQPLVGGDTIEPGQAVLCAPRFFPPADSGTHTITRDDHTVVATTASYTATAADIGHELTCDATGTNAAGSGEVIGAGVWVTSSRIPTPQSLPLQDEPDVTFHVGQSIGCSAPFAITGALTQAIGWKLGAAAVVNGGDHVVAPGDLGGQLRCVESGTNPAGTGQSAGPAVVLAAAAAPYGGTANLTSDLAWVGDRLDCTTAAGAWHGTPPTSFTRTWRRDASTITGETGASYTTVAGDANHGVGCTTEGINTTGTGETVLVRGVWVLPSAVPFVRSQPFTNTGETPYPGQTATCYPGTWGGGGVAFTYTWRRNGTPISGQTGSSYTLQSGDSGSRIGCVVKGANVLGDLTIVTTSVAVFDPPHQTHVPVNVTPPSIVGGPAIGSLLTCNAGTWNYLPTIFSVAWKRGTKSIAGATHNAYTVTKADAGFAITCSVTAANNVGPATASSAALAIAAIKPVNTAAPKIGKVAIGKLAKVSTGTWVGAASITYKYQWYRGSAKIKGATKSSYKVAKADKGKKLSCRVTATDRAGSTTKASNTVTAK